MSDNSAANMILIPCITIAHRIIWETIIITCRIEDMRFTIESARCLGCCSLAPAVMVNGKVYGRVKTRDLPKILKDYE